MQSRLELLFCHHESLRPLKNPIPKTMITIIQLRVEKQMNILHWKGWRISSPSHFPEVDCAHDRINLDYGGAVFIAEAFKLLAFNFLHCSSHKFIHHSWRHARLSPKENQALLSVKGTLHLRRSRKLLPDYAGTNKSIDAYYEKCSGKWLKSSNNATNDKKRTGQGLPLDGWWLEFVERYTVGSRIWRKWA